MSVHGGGRVWGNLYLPTKSQPLHGYMSLGYDFHKDFVFHSSSPPPLGEAGWLDGAGVRGIHFCHSSGARLWWGLSPWEVSLCYGGGFRQMNFTRITLLPPSRARRNIFFIPSLLSSIIMLWTFFIVHAVIKNMTNKTAKTTLIEFFKIGRAHVWTPVT